MHAKLGQADAELAVRREILDLVTQLHGTKHWTTINAQWWLDDRERFAAMGSCPRHSTAEGYFAQVLATRKDVLGELHPDTIECLVDIGRLAETRGDMVRASGLIDRALKLQEAVGGEDVVVRAGMLGDAGRLLFAQGDYAGALQRFEQATAVFRKFTLGDGSAPPSTPDPRTAGPLECTRRAATCDGPRCCGSGHRQLAWRQPTPTTRPVPHMRGSSRTSLCCFRKSVSLPQPAPG